MLKGYLEELQSCPCLHGRGWFSCSSWDPTSSQPSPGLHGDSCSLVPASIPASSKHRGHQLSPAAWDVLCLCWWLNLVLIHRRNHLKAKGICESMAEYSRFTKIGVCSLFVRKRKWFRRMCQPLCCLWEKILNSFLRTLWGKAGRMPHSSPEEDWTVPGSHGRFVVATTHGNDAALGHLGSLLLCLHRRIVQAVGNN